MIGDMDDFSVRSLPTGARAGRKRRAIVEAARERFLNDGYDTSVEAIAAEAGL